MADGTAQTNILYEHFYIIYWSIKSDFRYLPFFFFCPPWKIMIIIFYHTLLGSGSCIWTFEPILAWYIDIFTTFVSFQMYYRHIKVVDSENSSGTTGWSVQFWGILPHACAHSIIETTKGNSKAIMIFCI